MELIFFLVAGMVLCSGFRMRIMVITHQVLFFISAHTELKTLSEGLESIGSWEKAQPGQLIPPAKGMFCTVWHCAVQ